MVFSISSRAFCTSFSIFSISSMGFGGGVVARAYPTQASMPKTAAAAINAVS